MSRILTIATNTVREAIRDKVLYTILFFAVILLFVSLGMEEISIGDTEKVVRGVALGGVAFLGAVIALFLGIGLVHKEIERKTVYTLASKPLPRWHIILGKYLGLWLTLAIEITILAALYTLIVGLGQGLPEPRFYLVFIMLMGELTLLTAWATLFSTFASPMMAAAYSMCVYLIGHFADDIKTFGAAAEDPTVQQIAAVLYRVLPNLEVFNIRAEAVHRVAVPGAEIGWALAYGLGYTAVVLGVAMVVFERRDFK